jgi:hypothetical protein
MCESLHARIGKISWMNDRADWMSHGFSPVVIKLRQQGADEMTQIKRQQGDQLGRSQSPRCNVGSWCRIIAGLFRIQRDGLTGRAQSVTSTRCPRIPACRRAEHGGRPHRYARSRRKSFWNCKGVAELSYHNARQNAVSSPLEAMAVTGKSKSGEAGRKVLIARADARASRLAPIVAELRRGGITSWYAIAMELNRRGVPTATGRGIWEPGQVRRVMERAERRRPGSRHE